MQLKPSTIELLENFSRNFDQIKVSKGTESFIKKSDNSMVVRAVFEDDFEDTMCIYNIKDFLSKLSFGEKPEVSWNYDPQGTPVSLNITNESGTYKVVQALSDEEYVDAPTQGITLPQSDLSFVLTEESLKAIKKAVAMMKAEYIVFTKNDQGKLIANVMTQKDDDINSNRIELVLGDLEDGTADFKYRIKASAVEFVETDYAVEVCAQGVIQFTAQLDGVELVYWIALAQG